MAKAIEQLQRRLANERVRHTRYRDKQRDAGKKQVNIWLAPGEVAALRKIQEAAGGLSQVEAIALAILRTAELTARTP